MTTVKDLTKDATAEPNSNSGLTARADDPVLAAIEAAPLVPATDEENAALDELERTTHRWIPHDEFIAALGKTRDR